jgi:prepilin-type N-terminal cleavage/methylation domain-containing protein
MQHGISTTTTGRSRSDGGFSIIEVIISIVLISLVATAALSTIRATVVASVTDRDAALLQAWVQTASDNLMLVERVPCTEGVDAAIERYSEAAQAALMPSRWEGADASISVVAVEFLHFPIGAGAPEWSSEDCAETPPGCDPSDPSCVSQLLTQRITIQAIGPKGRTSATVSVIKNNQLSDWTYDPVAGFPEECPFIEGQTQYASATITNSHTVSLPAGARFGDTLLVLTRSTLPPAIPAGWSRLSNLSNNGISGVYVRMVQDGEAQSVTFTTGVSNGHLVANAYLVSNGGRVTSVIPAATATASPEQAASPGFLSLVGTSGRRSDAFPTGPPSGYGGLLATLTPPPTANTAFVRLASAWQCVQEGPTVGPSPWSIQGVVNGPHYYGVTVEKLPTPLRIPEITGTATSAPDILARTHVVNLPAGIQAGERLVVVSRSNAVTTGPADWTRQIIRTNNGSTTLFTKIAGPNEPQTVTLSTGTSSVRVAAVSHRIANAENMTVGASVVSIDPPAAVSPDPTTMHLSLAVVTTRRSSWVPTVAPMDFRDLVFSAPPSFDGATFVAAGSAWSYGIISPSNPSAFVFASAVDEPLTLVPDSPHSVTLVFTSGTP